MIAMLYWGEAVGDAMLVEAANESEMKLNSRTIECTDQRCGETSYAFTLFKAANRTGSALFHVLVRRGRYYPYEDGRRTVSFRTHHHKHRISHSAKSLYTTLGHSEASDSLTLPSDVSVILTW